MRKTILDDGKHSILVEWRLDLLDCIIISQVLDLGTGKRVRCWDYAQDVLKQHVLETMGVNANIVGESRTPRYLPPRTP